MTRQREDCERLCAEKGWEPVEYMDNDVSASNGKTRSRSAGEGTDQRPPDGHKVNQTAPSTAITDHPERLGACPTHR